MVITSWDNEKVKKYRKLKKRKYREEYEEFIVEGMHLVLEAFKSGIIEELIMEENKRNFLLCRRYGYNYILIDDKYKVEIEW